MQNQAMTRRSAQEIQKDAVAATSQRVAEFQKQVDNFAGHLTQALPRHVSLDRFKRVLITAAAMNPDLLLADRRTLFLSSIKCASDGLLPDGRQAALVVYNTEIKRRDPVTGIDQKFRIDAVSYMPMLAGIRERMRNTGEVVSADAHVVCKQDRFEYRLGDNASIEHEPPPLGQDRGEIVGAYAIIRLKSGEVLRDVMSKQEIEQTRSQSRAKDSLMWSKFYAEAARKTVLRRCSKAAPQTADAERLFARDDDDLEDGANMAAPAGFPPLTELPIAEPEPIREPDGEVVEDEPSFEVTDLDGEVFAFHEAKVAAKALRSLYADAASRGPQFVAGAVESNRAVQEQLEQAGERFEMPAEKKPAAPVPLVDDDPPFPGDLPSTQSLAIPVPRRMPADKPDYRGWALGMLLPRVRQANSSADLGMLLGDNEEALTQAKRALAAADRQELDREIAARWDEIAEIERAPA
jgi:recombination protein RecT